MGSRLGRRVIHFANLPIKMLMPSSFENIKEVALKTIPSASKIEIKRVLESLYGFDVEKPDYKKAYVTLKMPLSLNPNLFPIPQVEEERRNTAPKDKKSIIVDQVERKSHWLDDTRENSTPRPGKQPERGFRDQRYRRGHVGPRENKDNGKTKFPWSSMRNLKMPDDMVIIHSSGHGHLLMAGENNNRPVPSLHL
ncbi:hypothetical protein H6P81_020322 [Aristolochia fimbriata]|uniref:Large ribosomal subunit protein uL23m n=1 Tax=Aristolochia fimbriata TaxID=158543 RepID=A0AAV7DYD6_ARIFI|nr:hypothetical protein H6P81_020322 [Aristolochia fimbriata]